jgi:hypothetical protein
MGVVSAKLANGLQPLLRLGIATLACVALALAYAMPTLATPAWLAPVTLSETGPPNAPSIAVDASGDVTAGWGSLSGSSYETEVDTRPAGGSWQAPERLSAPGEAAFAPKIAVDPQGAAVAVWESGGPEDTAVQAATRSTATSSWSAPVELAAAGDATTEAHVAIDAAGNIAAVWVIHPENPGPAYVEAATRPAGGTWSTPAVISQGNSASWPRIAVDSHGNFTAIWGGFDVIESAVKPADSSSWSSPEVLSDLDTGAPALAANANGEIVAAWILAISNSERRIQSAVKPAGGSWGAPVYVSAITSQIGIPDVAIDEHGDAVVSWSESGSSTSGPIEAAFKPAADSWQAPTELSETEPPESAPQVVFDAHGNAIAVWWGVKGSENVIQSSLRPTGASSWQTPVALSGEVRYSSRPVVAVDDEGNAVAAWENGFGYGKGVLQAAGYDAAGPRLGGLSIPSTATAGLPVAFSVSPLDVWSTLGATRWSFGDGASATATSTTHTYAAPGSYTLTVTSEDVLGNATSSSQTIFLSPGAATRPRQPVISNARLTNGRFRVARRATAVMSRRASLGTVFRFSLSARATVQVGLTHATAGLRRGDSCLAPTAVLERAHARQCTRRVLVAVLTRKAELAGADSIPFSGRVGHRALRPGSYTATLSATDAGGQSQPVSLTFVIVP